MSEELELELTLDDNVQAPYDNIKEVVTPTLQSLNAGQRVTFQIVDDYEAGSNTINVKITCQDTNNEMERSVNVCFDADGKYDADATLVRIGEVRDGQANKFASSVLQISAE